MSVDATVYNVFFASPVNLKEERKAFSPTLYTYSFCESLSQNVMFAPKLWEFDVNPGMGRPQDLINKILDESDYMILVLWDRWGSPSGSTEGSTSACEEEFRRARRNLDDKTMPMKDIAVFFKDVNSRQMQDPGEQLEKVLKFRDELTRTQTCLFNTYSDKEQFSVKLRSQLGGWARDHKHGIERIYKRESWIFSSFQNKHIEHIKFPGELDPEHELGEELLEELQEAKRLGDTNEVLRAQNKYEEITSNNPQLLIANNDYAKFLYRIGNLDRARDKFTEILISSIEQKLTGWTSRAYANLAIIDIGVGNLDSAEKYLAQSVEFNEILSHGAGLADNHRWQAKVFQIRGDFRVSHRLLFSADKAFRDMGYEPGIADIQADLCAVLLAMGRYEEAFSHVASSLELNKKLKRNSCQADNYALLGRVSLARGQIAEATKNLEIAREINVGLKRKHGIANSLALLGELYIQCDDLERAEDFLMQARDLSEELGKREEIAQISLSLGQMYFQKGDDQRAREYLQRARAEYGLMKSKDGDASAGLALGRLALRNNDMNLCEGELLKSLVYWETIGNPVELGRCYELQSAIHSRGGLLSDAITSCKMAIKCFSDSGAKLEESWARKMLSQLYGTSGDERNSVSELEASKKIQAILGNSEQEN